MSETNPSTPTSQKKWQTAILICLLCIIALLIFIAVFLVKNNTDTQALLNATLNPPANTDILAFSDLETTPALAASTNPTVDASHCDGELLMASQEADKLLMAIDLTQIPVVSLVLIPPCQTPDGQSTLHIRFNGDVLSDTASRGAAIRQVFEGFQTADITLSSPKLRLIFTGTPQLIYDAIDTNWIYQSLAQWPDNEQFMNALQQAYQS